MTIQERLERFYKENNLPHEGGADKNTFRLKVFGINWKFPNPQFRKDVIHIHDIQHILNDCDTSWKGEAYISGWELSTGMWKYFPISIFSFWAAGYSLWIHPYALFQGYKKGLNDIGIIDLNIEKSDFMKMDMVELQKITSKKEHTKMGFLQWFQFVFWMLLSAFLFLLPFMAILVLILYII